MFNFFSLIIVVFTFALFDCKLFNVKVSQDLITVLKKVFPIEISLSI